MSLSDIYKKFSDRVQFLVIYIREAHPTDGWWFYVTVEEETESGIYYGFSHSYLEIESRNRLMDGFKIAAGTKKSTEKLRII